MSIESAYAGAVGRMNSRILEIGRFMPNHTVINFCAGFGMENTLIASRIRPDGRLLAVDSNTNWLHKLDAALERRSLRSIVDIRPHDVTLPLSADFTASHLLCLLALHYLKGSSAVTDMWRRYATPESLFITADWLPGQVISTDWAREIEKKLPAVGNLWQLEATEVIAEGWHEVGVGALRYVGIVIRCWSPAGEPIAPEGGQ